MSRSSTDHATELLHRLRAGDAHAGEELLPLVYEELHRIAASLMSEQRGDHTLQATALVHEAYLRLVDEKAQASFESRAHFLCVAAKAMRSVLVDHARRRGAGKRSAAGERITLSQIGETLDADSPDLLALDEALTGLAAMDETLARVVELRFFGGLSVEETARVLSVSEPTVVRAWRVARMWLQRELSRGPAGGIT
ncbi:MAG TPA: ECF-type sigma factor [Planctomycetota bacterium]|jgi:RNA polymerase sigma factor (TIGR02999 family)|nr:ECF-type sigma factor [Planctomycetota bacterium]